MRLKKVLVLDNDPRILDVMKEALNYEGFQVNTFEGTDDIIRLIKQFEPDILLFDYILNGTNGGELCRMVKTNAATSMLPVIIFSAYPKVLQSLGFYSCDAFIAKPFDLEYLTEKVNQLLSDNLKPVLIS